MPIIDWQIPIFRLLAVCTLVGGLIWYAKYNISDTRNRMLRLENETFKNFTHEISMKIDTVNQTLCTLVQKTDTDSRIMTQFMAAFIEVNNYNILLFSAKNDEMRSEIIAMINKTLSNLQKNTTILPQNPQKKA